MVRGFAIFIACFATALVYPSARAAQQPKVVCESDASGAAMNCRDAWPGEDAASFRRVAPTPTVPTGTVAAPTRPLLAPPQREASAAPAPRYLRAGSADPQRAPMVLAVPSTTIAEQPVRATATVDVQAVAPRAPVVRTTSPPEAVVAKTEQTREATTVAATPSPLVVERVAAEITPAPSETLPAPKPIDTPVASAPTAPVAVAAAMPVAQEALPPVVVAPPPVIVATPPPPAATVPLLDGAAFRALDGSHFTLELANAKSPEPLRDLAARLQLAGAVYLVHLRSPESDRWLLTWADHAGQAEARSARSMVPADSAINSGWPRRIAPLQKELVLP